MLPETIAVHAGEEPNLEASGDVVVPIHLSTTFARRKTDSPTGGWEYSRSGNPTRHALEQRLAALEKGFGGLAFASGLAAETTALFLLKKGDKVVACDDLYGGTYRLFDKCFTRFGTDFQFLDFARVEESMKHVTKNTKMLWLETPTNPLLKIYDIKEISARSHEINPEIIVVVDNTFASPYFQNPLSLGADLVVHSTTKYIAGHSDVIGGALIAKTEELFEQLKFYQNALGAIQSPFDSFLTLRGTKTLALRMEKHQENALAVAKFLETQPKVSKVYYPGLESHPQNLLAIKQMQGFSGMISFELDASVQQAKRFVESTKLFALAESLGGVESLIEHPASMTHASIPSEQRIKAGLNDGLIRAAVGIENKNDLIEDLNAAFKEIET